MISVVQLGEVSPNTKTTITGWFTATSIQDAIFAARQRQLHELGKELEKYKDQDLGKHVLNERENIYLLID